MRRMILLTILFLVPGSVFASSIQERRAMQEAQAMKQKKQQEAALMKKQRDELMINYKMLTQSTAQAQAQMEVAQRDYKTATVKFNSAKEEQVQLEKQIVELQRNRGKLDAVTIEKKMQKLRESQSQLIAQMKTLTQIQQQSYESMRNYDMQYRNFLAKEQILRQQIETAQRQLQFVISQP